MIWGCSKNLQVPGSVSFIYFFNFRFSMLSSYWSFFLLNKIILWFTVLLSCMPGCNCSKDKIYGTWILECWTGTFPGS